MPENANKYKLPVHHLRKFVFKVWSKNTNTQKNKPALQVARRPFLMQLYQKEKSTHSAK